VTFRGRNEEKLSTCVNEISEVTMEVAIDVIMEMWSCSEMME